LGHFLAAKLVKVRVETFSLGLGRRLFGRKYGETDYCISAIPLGGFVKLAGEEETGKAPEPHEFGAKTPGQKAIVFGAGVFFNILFALGIFIFAFAWGVPRPLALVGDTIPGSPAWEAGIRKGDRIVKAMNREDPTFDYLIRLGALSGPEEPIYLEIARGSEISRYDILPEYDPDLGLRKLGISPAIANEITDFANPPELGARNPAMEAGLKIGDSILLIEDAPAEPNQVPEVFELKIKHLDNITMMTAGYGQKLSLGRFDKIVEINGRPAMTGNEVIERIDDSPEKALSLVIKRDNSIIRKTVIPAKVAPTRLGISSAGNILDKVARDGFAYRAGLRANDRILESNGEPITSLTQLDVLETNDCQSVELKIDRNGEQKIFQIDLSDDNAAKEFLESIFAEPSLRIAYVLPGSAADVSGLQGGDVVTRVDGQKIARFMDIVLARERSYDKPMLFEWERAGKLMQTEVKPTPVDPEADGMIGVIFGKTESELYRTTPGRAIIEGCYETYDAFMQTIATVGRFFDRSVSAKNLGGPIAIVHVSYRSVILRGVGGYASLLGLLSVGLVLINLLPIPVTDGGMLVLLAYEKIRGKPLNEKARAGLYYTGWAIIIAIFALVMYNDLSRLLDAIKDSIRG